MNRRNIFRSILAAATGAVAARASAQTSDVPRVVYHVTDLDKVGFVLGNIKNHFEGVGGPDKVKIAVVVHGPALKAFHRQGALADIVSRAANHCERDCQGMRSGATSPPCARTDSGWKCHLHGSASTIGWPVMMSSETRCKPLRSHCSSAVRASLVPLGKNRITATSEAIMVFMSAKSDLMDATSESSFARTVARSD